MVEQALQYECDVHLGEDVRGLERVEQDGEELWRLTTDKGGDYLSRTLIITAGHGAFEPRTLPIPGPRGLARPRPALLRDAQGRVRRRALRDRRRRRLRARLDREPAGHRVGPDPPRAPPRPLPRARVVAERGAPARRRGSRTHPHALRGARHPRRRAHRGRRHRARRDRRGRAHRLRCADPAARLHLAPRRDRRVGPRGRRQEAGARRPDHVRDGACPASSPRATSPTTTARSRSSRSASARRRSLRTSASRGRAASRCSPRTRPSRRLARWTRPRRAVATCWRSSWTCNPSIEQADSVGSTGDSMASTWLRIPRAKPA